MTWEEDRTMTEKQQRGARRPPPSSRARGDGKVTKARERAQTSRQRTHLGAPESLGVC